MRVDEVILRSSECVRHAHPAGLTSRELVRRALSRGEIARTGWTVLGRIACPAGPV